MTTDSERRGYESSYRGELAERTFTDMLRWWLSGTGAASPSQLIPDTQKVDIKVTIPSLWAGVEKLRQLGKSRPQLTSSGCISVLN